MRRLRNNIRSGAFDVDFSRARHYIVDLFTPMRAHAIPLVARVNGHVMAGGFDLLCACDLAVAVEGIAAFQEKRQPVWTGN
jgi:enoyl-CoA hydratase/carnithine racemase